MNILYLLFVIELFIGGGGRLFSFGSVTARMIIFSLCLVAHGILSLTKGRQPGLKIALILVGLFFLTHLHAVGLGLLNGQKIEFIISEFQKALFWLCAPFIAHILKKPVMVERTAAILQKCSIFLSASYLLLILLILVGVVNPILLYEVASESGEFFFRTDSLFFYKGFIYIAIGMLFFVALQGKRWQFWSLFLCLALVLTLTRGFLFAASIAIVLMITSQRRWRLLFLVVSCVVVASVFVFVYFPSTDSLLEANRLNSSNQRLEDMSFIFTNIDPLILLFGDGYGSLINGRLEIENTYLFLLWKLGIFGLLFWLIPLAVCTFYYLKIREVARSNLAAAYYFGVILIYIQTATNPYLDNPIGLSYVIISIFSLRTIFHSIYDVNSMSQLNSLVQQRAFYHR